MKFNAIKINFYKNKSIGLSELAIDKTCKSTHKYVELDLVYYDCTNQISVAKVIKLSTKYQCVKQNAITHWS